MICFKDKTYCNNSKCAKAATCRLSVQTAIKEQEELKKKRPGWFELPYSVTDFSSLCKLYKEED